MIGSRQEHEPGVGQGGDQPVRGAREITVAQDDEHLSPDRGDLGFGQRSVRPAQARGQRGPVVSRRASEVGQRCGHRPGRLVGLPGLDGPGRGLWIGAGEDAVAGAGDGDPPEPARRGGGRAEQDLGAEAEAHRIHLPGPRQRGEDRLLERGVGGRVPGPGRLPVAEQVHADHRAALVAQQVSPARLAPVPLIGGREAVHQDDGYVVHCHLACRSAGLLPCRAGRD
jgi:hypothetical protein